jgi:EAL domain-containing protein (putative c-di-GMP-specific phosphodiesterase class I)
VIVRSTIELAHNLGLRVVAEGAEQHEVLTRLTELGCDEAQGYGISRPLTSERFELWLARATAPRPASRLADRASDRLH